MSLSIDYTELKRKVGRFAGFGPVSGWIAQQAEDVDDSIVDGLRRFYFPDTVEGGQSPHVWSFLRRLASLTLESGVSWYELPSDFVSMVGDVTVEGQNRPLQLITEEQLRAFQPAADTGDIRYCAIRASSNNTIGATLWEMGFYPTPEAAGSASFYYQFDPGLISDLQPDPVGGPYHADTILYSCLAAFEERFDDKTYDGPSPKRAEFMLRLASSIAHDMKIGGR